MYILRSRTDVTGSTATRQLTEQWSAVDTGVSSSHAKRPPTSALSGFDLSLFDFIQPDVSSTHLESLVENETTPAGRHEPYTCV